MSENEFDVLDELYFVTSYDELEKRLPDLTEELVSVLVSLLTQGFIKCLMNESDEEIFVVDKFTFNYKKYNYLATKAGLLAHNSK